MEEIICSKTLIQPHQNYFKSNEVEFDLKSIKGIAGNAFGLMIHEASTLLPWLKKKFNCTEVNPRLTDLTSASRWAFKISPVESSEIANQGCLLSGKEFSQLIRLLDRYEVFTVSGRISSNDPGQTAWVSFQKQEILETDQHFSLETQTDGSFFYEFHSYQTSFSPLLDGVLIHGNICHEYQKVSKQNDFVKLTKPESLNLHNVELSPGMTTIHFDHPQLIQTGILPEELSFKVNVPFEVLEAGSALVGMYQLAKHRRMVVVVTAQGTLNPNKTESKIRQNQSTQVEKRVFYFFKLHKNTWVIDQPLPKKFPINSGRLKKETYDALESWKGMIACSNSVENISKLINQKLPKSKYNMQSKRFIFFPQQTIKTSISQFQRQIEALTKEFIKSTDSQDVTYDFKIETPKEILFLKKGNLNEDHGGFFCPASDFYDDYELNLWRSTVAYTSLRSSYAMTGTSIPVSKFRIIKKPTRNLKIREKKPKTKTTETELEIILTLPAKEINEWSIMGAVYQLLPDLLVVGLAGFYRNVQTYDSVESCLEIEKKKTRLIWYFFHRSQNQWKQIPASSPEVKMALQTLEVLETLARESVFTAEEDDIPF